MVLFELGHCTGFISSVRASRNSNRTYVDKGIVDFCNTRIVSISFDNFKHWIFLNLTLNDFLSNVVHFQMSFFICSYGVD